jgi:uncharacterized membrane protein
MKSRGMRRATAHYFWDRLKVSLWFVPAVMALAAFFLSLLLGWLDSIVPNELLNNSKLIIAGSPSEIRAAMMEIAGTILATAGVVFSLLTLPLSTVAAQYGSRLLRVFMRDRTTQFVLGIFVASFCYALAVALSIPLDAPQEEMPQISATFGFYLMLVTFASLILLIQHISIMLQAPNIAAAAAKDLNVAIQVEIPDVDNKSQKRSEALIISGLVDAEAYPFQGSRKGYIQFVDPEIIVNLAKEEDLVIRLIRKPGHFIGLGETVALVWPAAHVDAAVKKNLKRAVQIGDQRTPNQDIEYAVNQLVEISVRAMSPAINDPFTAITCLDHLADALASYMRSGEASPNFYDQDGKLRMFYEPTTMAQLLSAAFDQLRHCSCDNATVLLQMLKTIEKIGRMANTDEARRELLRHIDLVHAESQAGSLVEADKRLITLRCEMVEANLC